MSIQDRHFRNSREWSLIRQNALVRFRPHERVPAEKLSVTLPLACDATRGRLGQGVLGPEFRRCAALVDLMVGGGSLDLLLLSRSGDVALGECKRQQSGNAFRFVANAVAQLSRYERKIRRGCRKTSWLPARIRVSYRKFGFPPFRNVLREMGVKTPRAQGAWWRKVARNCSRGRIRFFAVVGDDTTRRATILREVDL